MASTLPFNLQKLDPKSADFLNDLKRDIFLSLKCHDVGTIREVSFEKQTVSISINYKRTMVEPSKDGSYVQTSKDYPILLDCPFISLRGGTSGLSLPIKAGDTCLVFYNDRAIDEWFATGSITQVASTRLHSMSDGIALVGVNSLKNLIDNYDSERAVLYNGDSKIAVGSKIEISNSSQNLNTVLQDLISKVQNLATKVTAITVPYFDNGTPMTSGVPNNAAEISAIISELSSVSSNLGGLLE